VGWLRQTRSRGGRDITHQHTEDPSHGKVSGLDVAMGACEHVTLLTYLLTWLGSEPKHPEKEPNMAHGVLTNITHQHTEDPSHGKVSGLDVAMGACEHVRHDKSGIAHRGNNRVEALMRTPSGPHRGATFQREAGDPA